MLRYAGIAAVLAMVSGSVAWLSQSNLVSFFALLAMNLALVLAVAFVVLAVGNYRDPSDPQA
jgi:predicted signal transduction protein with EAL and GGDEF domain